MSVTEIVDFLPFDAAACMRFQSERACAGELERVRRVRSPDYTSPRYEICYPTLRVVTQGAARMTFGDVELGCSSMQAFLVDEKMPACFQITETSVDRPFCCISVDLDHRLLQNLMRELGPVTSEDTRVGAVSMEVRGPLADCVLRLTKLLDSAPRALDRVSSALIHELHFWLLVTHYGTRFPASGQRRLQGIAAAVRMIREQRDRLLRVPHVARAAAMSQSGFHQYFKVLTSLTPLQYQKHLRMIEARHLLMTRSMTAFEAGSVVGYKSASQFSREYSRFFGSSPAQDARAVSGLGGRD